MRGSRPSQDDFAPRQEQQAEHGRDGDGDNERGQQRHDIRLAKRLQKPALDAGEEKDRREYQNDDERGKQDGISYLHARLIHDLQRRPPLRRGQRRVFAQPTEDILHVNHRVIDKRADGNGHAAERHSVDGRAKRLQQQNRGNKGERNGENRD